jgi:hypothetical protein
MTNRKYNGLVYAMISEGVIMNSLLLIGISQILAPRIRVTKLSGCDRCCKKIKYLSLLPY